MNDSIQKRYQLRVKQRRRVVQYAELHGLRPATRAETHCRSTFGYIYITELGLPDQNSNLGHGDQ